MPGTGCSCKSKASPRQNGTVAALARASVLHPCRTPCVGGCSFKLAAMQQLGFQRGRGLAGEPPIPAGCQRHRARTPPLHRGLARHNPVLHPWRGPASRTPRTDLWSASRWAHPARHAHPRPPARFSRPRLRATRAALAEWRRYDPIAKRSLIWGHPTQGVQGFVFLRPFQKTFFFQGRLLLPGLRLPRSAGPRPRERGARVSSHIGKAVLKAMGSASPMTPFTCPPSKTQVGGIYPAGA